MGGFLFTMLPAAGHVNPTLPIVRELVRRGEEVEYWTTPDFAAAVQAAGATFRPIEDFRPTRTNPLTSPITMVRTFRKMKTAPPQLLGRAAERPDMVLVSDSMLPWSSQVPLPAVSISTTTPLNDPIMAAWLARRIPGRGAVTRWLRRRVAASRLPGLIVGRTPLRVLVPRGPLVIVTVPRAFQPLADTFGSDWAFVGPTIVPRPADPPLPDGLDPDRPLVFVSLGTNSNDRPRFYEECMRAFAGTDWQVVMAVGDRVPLDAMGPIPDNVVIMRRAPQLRVLERAAAFVSHGGMGSVMESLHHGVPMVLYPQMAEQSANANRVVANHAGIRLTRTPQAAEIRAAVQRVMSDPETVSGLAALQHALHTAGGAAMGADLLQDFAARHRAA